MIAEAGDRKTFSTSTRADLQVMSFLLRLAVATGTIAAPCGSLMAQTAERPTPTWVIHVQAGVSSANFIDVSPANPDVQFRRRNAPVLGVRVSRAMTSFTALFGEMTSARRGSRFVVPDSPWVEQRTSWLDITAGVTLTVRCSAFVCLEVDAAGVLARLQDNHLYDQGWGKRMEAFPFKDSELSGLIGARLVVPRWRNAALVLRHQEGFTSLPTDENANTRSRAQTLMLSVPLNR